MAGLSNGGQQAWQELKRPQSGTQKSLHSYQDELSIKAGSRMNFSRTVIERSLSSFISRISLVVNKCHCGICVPFAPWQRVIERAEQRIAIMLFLRFPRLRNELRIGALVEVEAEMQSTFVHRASTGCTIQF